jgi:dTDP-N-acetylfucosamine:lipid II N-acetylfucosaminyltransferase
MNYHFFVDDKFFDEYIEELKSINNSNVFVFTFESPSKYIKSNDGIHAPYGSQILIDIVNEINENDTITIHWFTIEVFNHLIKCIPNNTKVYLQLMGGDFLEVPIEAGVKNRFGDFLYEPITKRYMESKAKHYRNSLFKENLLKFDINFFTKTHILINYLFFFKLNYFKVVKIRKKFLNRLTGIMNWNHYDVEEIEKLYEIKLQYIFNTYNSGLLDVNFKPKNQKKIGDKLNFLVGNSGGEAGNHLDVFEVLSKFKINNIEIYSSLSYGCKRHIENIINNGYKYFGYKFIPLTEFMKLDEYYDFFDNIDVCVMNHKRTNAGGNIAVCLKKGIPVFLNPKSSIYTFYNNNGVKIYSINQFKNMHYNDLIEIINHERLNAKTNSKRFDELFSIEKRHEKLREIYKD